MDISDNELVRRIIIRDEKAFAELTHRYGRLVKAIVKYHLRDISMWQEDCVNDILFTIWQNIDRFDAQKNTLKNWIGAVAKYRSINYKRKYYRELLQQELSEDIADGNNVDANLMRKEIEQEIISLLSGLSPGDREIFINRYIRSQSVDEIAAAVNKKPSWIYNRLSRGRKKLRVLYVTGNNHE